MSDYKYDAQVKAEEMAEERFHCDFYELSDSMQFELYTKALESVWDCAYGRADAMEVTK